jgi:hypothetical protein
VDGTADMLVVAFLVGFVVAATMVAAFFLLRRH